jgi:hypothetical protein
MHHNPGVMKQLDKELGCDAHLAPALQKPRPWSRRIGVNDLCVRQR